MRVEIVSANFETHQQFLVENHGLKIRGAPEGFVIDGYFLQQSGLLEKIKTGAIPLMPDPKLGLNCIRGTRYLNRIQKMRGRNAFMLMVPDIRADSGWRSGPVTPRDFSLSPEVLLQAAYHNKAAGLNHIAKPDEAANLFEKAEGKFVAYMAVNGTTSSDFFFDDFPPSVLK